MDSTDSVARTLVPLDYHREVVACLKQHEPEVWAWSASLGAQEQQAREIREQLLRDSYRLAPESHPEPYRLCALAMQRLGMALPATLYQANAQGDGMNAMLCFLPGEVHLLLQGPILERLSEDEQLALFGHELAHHLLWSHDDGAFLIADRILHQTAADPLAAPSHVETARLYQLHTEVFADRGAAVAAQALAPPVQTLVKVQTGIAVVNAAAYLQQARELDAAGDGASRGHSHPESYIRAQALDLWWTASPDADGWVHRRIRGTLDLGRLDLIAQHRMTGITRELLAHFFAEPALRADRLLLQAREFFPDWTPEPPPLPLSEVLPVSAADSIRDYLHSVMLDLALADPELREPALRRALQIAQDLGTRDAFIACLARDAGLGKREIDKLAKGLAREARR